MLRIKQLFAFNKIMEAPTFVLYEHAAGYALFRLKEFEEIGNILPQVCVVINIFVILICLTFLVAG